MGGGAVCPGRLTEQPPHRCCPPHPCSVMTPRQASPQRFPKMELSRFPPLALPCSRLVSTQPPARSLQSARRRYSCCQIHSASERPAARHKELLSRLETSGEHPHLKGSAHGRWVRRAPASHASRHWPGCHRVGGAFSQRSKHCTTGGHLIPCFAPENVDEIPVWFNKHSGISVMTIIRVNVGLARPPWIK